MYSCLHVTQAILAMISFKVTPDSNSKFSLDLHHKSANWTLIMVFFWHWCCLLNLFKIAPLEGEVFFTNYINCKAKYAPITKQIIPNNTKIVLSTET